MRRLRAWAMRLAGLLTRDRRARHFDAELESHLEMHVEDNIRRGMTPEEARRQALIALGGAPVVRQAYQERGGVPALESLGQDLRFALRMLRKAPGFTAVAILVLALGIGANGAVFSLINAMLLKPLNGRLDAPLVGLYSGERARPDAFRLFSYREFVDLRSRNGVFAELFAEAGARLAVTEGGLTQRVPAAYVSWNYFRALKATPAIGRFFTAEEERAGSGAAVAVVSYGYWRRLGMPEDVIGRPITVNARPLTVVGVAPDGFRGTMSIVATALWLPLGAASLTGTDDGIGALDVADDRSSSSLMLSGTLEPGLSAEQAQARLEPLAAALAAAFPDTNRDQRLVVQPQSRWDRGDRPYPDTELELGAVVLMAMAGMVLVVACLNLANLQLARGSARRQEIAVRLALGGSRLRIVRQLFVEGLVLSGAAGAAALGLGWWAASRVGAQASTLTQGLLVFDTAPDGRVLSAIAVAAFLSAVVFALGPALKLSRPDLVTAIKQSGPLPAARRRRVSLSGLLVVAQVALSLTLLVATGVFARASVNAASSDPGFALDGGILVDVDAGVARMNEAETRAAYARVRERIGSLPDARAVSTASIVPFGRARDARFVRRDDLSVPATFTVVGSRYFETLGLPVVDGREFTPSEEEFTTEPVAVVDQTLAARLFPGRSPVGESVQLLRGDVIDGAPLQIVGVVPALRDDILGSATAHVYVPFGRHFRSRMTFHVRTIPGDEAAMMARVRQAILEVDPRLPVLSMNAMTAYRDGSPSLFGIRVGAALFAAFGLISLVLSAAGLYGLRAYLVSQRTRELGIRTALGATRRGIVRLLMQESAVTAAAGIGVGLALAIALVLVLRQSGMLYQVGAFDPVVLTIAPLVLVGATTVASYVPVRRALRVDPAVALRQD